MCYDYRRMNRDLEILDENFNIIESFTIGESLMDKQIPCVKIGQGKTKILLCRSVSWLGVSDIGVSGEVFVGAYSTYNDPAKDVWI